jgi:hypothetical protein
LFMGTFNKAPFILPMIQDPTSFTLCWRSFSRCGRDCFVCFLCNKGGQYFVYDYIWPFAPPNYPRYTTNNCWQSVDAHFQDLVGRVCLFVLVIKTANTS